MTDLTLSRAREARAAIERLYIEMRHLFNSGSYSHLGAPGEVLTEALLTLSPEIYGSMGDPDKVELAGLVYILDRLPRGIEECRFITLISEEGYSDSSFEVIMPNARRRNCYRIDQEHMLIEVTRGRSEIYDILTHLTFMYMEAEKIKNHVLDESGDVSLEWRKLEEIVQGEVSVHEANREVAFTHLSTILGQTFAETRQAWLRLEEHGSDNNGLFHAVYWLGRLAMEEELESKDRHIRFSPTLRERIGHHIYGERWADQIKAYLLQQQLFDRPLHIISANLHSVMNTLYALPALQKEYPQAPLEELALLLSQPENGELRQRVHEYALRHGMHRLDDPFGTNISVQIFDTARLKAGKLPPSLKADAKYLAREKPVLIVMDYAFGEQAYETMDELLKPFDEGGKRLPVPVASISIMGKAGILEGGKGDIMVPNAHIFEGTADNYPITNDFRPEDFAGQGVKVLAGPMISVLGTSLQNRDVLVYFHESSWGAIGLEMEGAHYQKAIQSAALIRKNIRRDVILRYAYYASDNPLISGSTLASGSLGPTGVKPTYLITRKILECIFRPPRPRQADSNEIDTKPA
ncbi:MAG: hypothetical protein D6722_14025 [Bacteroidetes bacterium]|nr:MAG: hypothetical protein D6722_14025 [Bacteroidota bacterium]